MQTDVKQHWLPMSSQFAEVFPNRLIQYLQTGWLQDASFSRNLCSGTELNLVEEAVNIATWASEMLGSVCHPSCYSVGAKSGGESQACPSHREVADQVPNKRH